MHYMTDKKAFVLTGKSFEVMELDDNGLAYACLGDDTNSVLMQGTNFRDDKLTDIYEGDVLFFRRYMNRVLLPMVGIVNAKDFSFCINSVVGQVSFGYQDKDIEVLGNIFQMSDEDLAKIVEKRFGEFAKKSGENKS